MRLRGEGATARLCCEDIVRRGDNVGEGSCLRFRCAAVGAASSGASRRRPRLAPLLPVTAAEEASAVEAVVAPEVVRPPAK